MNQLEEFLYRNSLEIKDCNNLIYNSIILSIFEELYHNLEDGENKKNLIQRIRDVDKENEIYLYQNFIRKGIQANINSEEEKLLINLLKAYLSKKNFRKSISDIERENILENQQNACEYCGISIDARTCHIDHIIPFKFVGDELNNNLQGLCDKCNLSKGGDLLHLYRLFIKKRIL